MQANNVPNGESLCPGIQKLNAVQGIFPVFKYIYIICIYLHIYTICIYVCRHMYTCVMRQERGRETVRVEDNRHV